MATDSTGDVLPCVSLSPEAAAAYHELARLLASAVRGSDLRRDEIPDERGYIDDEDHLVVYLDLPRVGRIEARIPPRDWAWADGRN